MLTIIKKFIPDLSQTSTWRGLVNILIAAGLLKDPAQAEALIALALAINGVIGVFFKDKVGKVSQ